MNSNDSIELQLAKLANVEEGMIPPIGCWECIERVLEAQRIINEGEQEIKTYYKLV